MAKDTSSQEYLNLKTELRSLLISSQQGCDEYQLMRDYNAYNGRKIPFHEMGYGNLIELLTSMPDVARMDQTRRPIIIHGIADQSTVHIKKFVMAQKRKKPSRNGRGGMNRSNFNNRITGPLMSSRNRQGYSNGIPFQPYSQIKSTQRNCWDTNNTQNLSIPQHSTKISYSSLSVINNSVQNQNFSNGTGESFTKMTTTKIVASFPPKPSPTSSPISILNSISGSIRATPTIDDNLSTIDDDINVSEDDELAAYDAQQAEEHGETIVFLRKRIRQLLLKYPSGVWLSSVHKLYQKTFNETLNLEDFKLKNLMAFFDCVSDFVNSERDRLPDSTDRLFLLKSKFIEATKREQQTFDQMKSTIVNNNSNTMSTNQNSFRHITNGINRPLVDLSSFVSFDFQYEQMKYNSNESFDGFLGDIENPWNIHIGNKQFIPKRDHMMTQLQDHYNQISNESIYVIPFEQIQINLSCVYYHDNDTYYRSSIIRIDSMINTDILILKIYLVDYGIMISDIHYHINSTNFKFLHKNFSLLPTEIYDCRLANIHYPHTSIQWHDDARQFIYDFIHGIDFSVQIIGFMDLFYCIYLWIEQKSINQLLIQHGFAIEFDDSNYSNFQPISSNLQAIPRIQSNINNNYIDERLLLRQQDNNIEFNIEENNLKHFIISIDHAYYFVKHPFTKRPCLPCFEVARLLNKDETFVSQLNLIRETEVSLSETHRILFNDLRCLSESIKCPHIHRNDDKATIKLYDLSSIKDYLCKIKFTEGDIIDAFTQEYDNYERAGYWNEKKNQYINNDNLQTHQEDLYQRKNMLNFRKEQLVSLSKSYHDYSSQNEIQDIEQKLKTTNEKLYSMEKIFPSTINNHLIYQTSPLLSSKIEIKSSNKKMRETLYRIARPIDQQFSLDICFKHQFLTNEIFNDINNDDIEELFQDLYRIIRNVIEFFTVESEILDENNHNLINQARNISLNLIEINIPLKKRIETYNDCLQIIEYFQPIIRYCLQRTDLIDIM
ncbi:unnamed protein product [Rotaria sordida]|uniref:HTH OST-type domain-containing protein n=2 Tax=Rotaria sordida TaxID=392033 RepID=A0A813Y7T3_9BILA|nr:unnamed protein product [Rotaria sordida]CAF0879173.1 unnamed protein product [Rotaria sordida]